MKNIFALILMVIAAGSLATDKSRPGANNGSVIEQPAGKPVDNQIQKEEDSRTDTEIRRDQSRRYKENDRRKREERMRRIQRSGTRAKILPPT